MRKIYIIQTFKQSNIGKRDIEKDQPNIWQTNILLEFLKHHKNEIVIKDIVNVEKF